MNCNKLKLLQTLCSDSQLGCYISLSISSSSSSHYPNRLNKELAYAMGFTFG